MNHNLIGIDEAGYGPTLGPLVASAVVFKVPHHRINLWRVLGKIIARQPGVPGKISVCDSKLLYQSQRGLKPLETSVLAFASLLPDFERQLPCVTIKKLVNKLTRLNNKTPSTLPWYNQSSGRVKIPLEADLDKINRLALILRQECRRKSIRLETIRVRIIAADQFNYGIKQCCNKAELLFETTAQLLKDLKKKYLQPGNGVEIYIDKQGGRTYYHGYLQRLFEPIRVSSLKQSRCHSVYSLDQPTVPNSRISFIQSGETSQFTIALASMFSKYFRELHMKIFNSFWQSRLPGLKPTAGYPQDARRFLKQILPLSQQLGIRPESFIRSR